MAGRSRGVAVGARSRGVAPSAAHNRVGVEVLVHTQVGVEVLVHTQVGAGWNQRVVPVEWSLIYLSPAWSVAISVTG